MYTFVFDKRSLVLLLAGVVVIAVSLATGGYLLGVRSGERSSAVRRMTMPVSPSPPDVTTPLSTDVPAVATSIQELVTSEPAAVQPAN